MDHWACALLSISRQTSFSNELNPHRLSPKQSLEMYQKHISREFCNHENCVEKEEEKNDWRTFFIIVFFFFFIFPLFNYLKSIWNLRSIEWKFLDIHKIYLCARISRCDELLLLLCFPYYCWMAFKNKRIYFFFFFLFISHTLSRYEQLRVLYFYCHIYFCGVIIYGLQLEITTHTCI